MYLAINTASIYTEWVIFDGYKIIFEESRFSKNNESEILLPSIKHFFSDKNIKFTDLKGLIVVSGPGSFTGLRVGITIVNALAYTLDIPIYEINLFDLYNLKDTCNLAEKVIISSGQSKVFMRDKNKNLNNLDVDLWDISNLKGKFIGELREKEVEILKNAELFLREKLLSFGEALGGADLNKFKKVDLAEPVYLQLQ